MKAPIIYSNRPLRSGIEFLLTLLVLFLFLALIYSGIVNFINTHPLGEDAMYRIKIYFYFSILNVFCLALWIMYNRVRFRKNRRKASQMIQPQELTGSLGINMDTWEILQRHKELVVSHNEEGIIQKATPLKGIHSS
ncbi:poly-beta-1,6-N-acetyl-D-glucosamine biosynthesis protein PgaD [Atlantibacter hermannii]|uniref:poly-beta-1,6-N-acetyl-D-glucosamine biosynthesis protein PgaD n=1 Tax=Atlantibacter hermannii TaxID=565 RepID=UPI00289CEC1F|nr:poly-beta-1,6-N-acetyl-D-glucosamine biosynthesis protein PgaD [Atlantibacter hermannii]